MSNSYDTDMLNQLVDISASEKRFQTSIIVKQDPGKAGILSILAKVEEETIPSPQRQAPQTVRPTTPQGGY